MSTSGLDESNVELFNPVSVDRVSQVIVNQVKLLIRGGRLSPGDRLPSERDLCVRFGVSRVTVREALRALEAAGLVEVRVGARGGAFVTKPTAKRIGDGLADLISLAPLTAASVTEARTVVELGILPLVVERATEVDIADLQAIVEKAEAMLATGTYEVGISAAFHARVATATHNPAIEALIHSFYGPMLMSLQHAAENAPAMGRQGTQEHRALVSAIAARDVDASIAVMSTHLARTAARTAERAAEDG